MFTWHDFGIFLSMLSFATILCYFLRTIDDSDVYVALIFELTVVLVSRFTDGYLFGLLSSVVGVIGINYIFTFPYYQLNFTISGYPLTFLVMLIVSVGRQYADDADQAAGENPRRGGKGEDARQSAARGVPRYPNAAYLNCRRGQHAARFRRSAGPRRQERSFWKTSATSQIGW